MSVRICGSFSSETVRGAELGGKVCWMLTAGGCCALQFTPGVSGPCIHAVLRNNLFSRKMLITCLFMTFSLSFRVQNLNY